MKAEKELKGIELNLVKELRKIWDNDDFVLGVRIHLKTDDERQEVIDAIKTKEIDGSDEVALYALQIHQDRK